MSNGNEHQDPAEAKREAENWIKEGQNKYISSGKIKDLGRSVHDIGDRNTPAHNDNGNPKPWSPKDTGHKLKDWTSNTSDYLLHHFPQESGLSIKQIKSISKSIKETRKFINDSKKLRQQFQNDGSKNININNTISILSIGSLVAPLAIIQSSSGFAIPSMIECGALSGGALGGGLSVIGEAIESAAATSEIISSAAAIGTGVGAGGAAAVQGEVAVAVSL